MSQQRPAHRVMSVHTGNITLPEAHNLPQASRSLSGKLADAVETESNAWVGKITEDSSVGRDIVWIEFEKPLRNGDVSGNRVWGEGRTIHALRRHGQLTPVGVILCFVSDFRIPALLQSNSF
jgi:hypothetical protein